MAMKTKAKLTAIILTGISMVGLISFFINQAVQHYQLVQPVIMLLGIIIRSVNHIAASKKFACKCFDL